MTTRAQATVLQFCTTLDQACGVAEYTRALAAAKGFACASRLDQLPPDPPAAVHLQHEFSIVPYDVLRGLAGYCRRHGTPLYVTLHTVPPRLPLAARGLHLASFALEKVFPPARRLPVAAARSRARWRAADTAGFQAPAAALETDHLLPWGAPSGYTVFVLRTLRLVASRARKVLVHSPEAARMLRSHGVARVGLATFGIDPHPIAPRLHSSADGRMHVGCFGFLNRSRCVLELIDACRRADAILHLLMSTARCGPDDDYAREVREAVRNAPGVEWTADYLPTSAVVWALSACDVNVYLSAPLDHLSSSGALRQYLAARRPIVATDSPRVADVRQLLHLLPDAEPERLAAALSRCPSEAPALAEWAERHTWDRIAADYD